MTPGIEIGLGALAKRSFLTDHDIYYAYLNMVVKQTGSEIGYLHLYDQDAEEISLAVWSEGVLKACSAVHGGHYPLSSAGIWADCIRQNKTVIHNSYDQTKSATGMPDGHPVFHNHMSTPIRKDSRIIAIIGVGNNPESYTGTEQNIVESLTTAGWPVVETKLEEWRNKSDQLISRYSEQSPREVLAKMLMAVGRALELRDEYTHQHQSNVAYICGRIAAQMALPTEQQFGLYLGAAVHDIGKIAIPTQILNKPGALHPAEYKLIQMHPTRGAEVFEHIDLPWPIVTMIQQHHERMDGSGYPDGLPGYEICLEARIIAVGDTFDAMAGDRPYRRAPGKAAAIDALKSGRDTKYDPYVVDAFLACVDDDPILMSDRFSP